MVGSPKCCNFVGWTTNSQKNRKSMELTLIILKPSSLQRALVGRVLNRFEQKGLFIYGLKMMQLDETILREHYAHLVDKPFFPSLVKSMTSTPVIVGAIGGKDAVACVRSIVGATNCRNAAPGTIRGDFGMSGQENIIHASDSVENARIEINRFFNPDEIFDYTPAIIHSVYSPDEIS